MRKRRSCAGVVALLAAGQFGVRGQEHRSTRDGVYTAAQASRGQAAYGKTCAMCHGDKLEGSGAATPPLTGSDFATLWAGQTIDDLFERIQTTMPADNPGTLTRAENADIISYILQVNKLPTGSRELPSDAETLKQIQFEAAK